MTQLKNMSMRSLFNWKANEGKRARLLRVVEQLRENVRGHTILERTTQKTFDSIEKGIREAKTADDIIHQEEILNYAIKMFNEHTQRHFPEHYAQTKPVRPTTGW